MNEVLSRPIQPDEIEWRIQSAKNGRTIPVPYITNRCVMSRFDEAFGPLGWQNSFELWRNKGVKCGVGVYSQDLGQWVWKYDGADESDIEPTKGGFSDSMKRVAVQWGLGRDLYTYPKIFIEGEHKFLPNWAIKELSRLVEAIISGKENREMVFLKEGGGSASNAPSSSSSGSAAPKDKVDDDRPWIDEKIIAEAVAFVGKLKNDGGTWSGQNVYNSLDGKYKMSKVNRATLKEKLGI